MGEMKSVTHDFELFPTTERESQVRVFTERGVNILTINFPLTSRLHLRYERTANGLLTLSHTGQISCAGLYVLAGERYSRISLGKVLFSLKMGTTASLFNGLE